MLPFALYEACTLEERMLDGYTRRDGLPAPQSIRGPWVSLSAPGADIVSLDPTGPGVVDRIVPIGSGQAVPIEGTSFATPYVSGVVALVRARYPGLSARQVRDRVVATATHPAGGGGRDDAVGAGTVDPVAALADVRGVELGSRVLLGLSIHRLVPPHVATGRPGHVGLAGAPHDEHVLDVVEPADGLVDELHLYVYPVAVGTGIHLFPEGTEQKLSLLGVEALSNGVAHLTYGPA